MLVEPKGGAWSRQIGFETALPARPLQFREDGMGNIYTADEEIPFYFCKYCGRKARLMLKSEDTCFNCFKIDETGATPAKYDHKTGEELKKA